LFLFYFLNYNCWLKAYIVLTFLDSVRQTAANLDQSRYTCTGQGPTTFTKFRARSSKWGRNGGYKSVPNTCVFL